MGSSKVRLVEEFNVRLVWLGPEGERRVFEGEIEVDGGLRSTTVVVGPAARQVVHKSGYVQRLTVLACPARNRALRLGLSTPGLWIM